MRAGTFKSIKSLSSMKVGEKVVSSSENAVQMTQEAADNSISEQVSMLTALLDCTEDQEGDFLLPTPSDDDPLAVKIKIYLFGTSNFLQLNISKVSKVENVIRHIMTVYKKDKPLVEKCQPLLYPLNPEAYELRLIDEDAKSQEERHKPYYEVGALDRRERIGEYESLAFVPVKNFKPKEPIPAM